MMVTNLPPGAESLRLVGEAVGSEPGVYEAVYVPRLAAGYHALAYVTKLAPTLPADDLLVMNLCGRGDKDVFAVAKMLGMKI